jgi:hypothetical protein
MTPRPDVRTERAGSCVVVTVFQLGSYIDLVRMSLFHGSIVREVRTACEGFVSAGAYRSWRDRQLTSISVWRSEDDLARIGYSDKHVQAAHWLAARRGRAQSMVYIFHDLAGAIMDRRVRERHGIRPA